VINLLVRSYCAEVAVFTTKDLMQLQPQRSHAIATRVLGSAVPESTSHRVEIVPGPYARNTYQCLVMCLYPLPVPCIVPSLYFAQIRHRRMRWDVWTVRRTNTVLIMS
jgi:hypothetical protein